MYAWLMNLFSRIFGKTAKMNMEKDEDENSELTNLENEKPTNDYSKKRKSILDRFGEKLKEFLDNA